MLQTSHLRHLLIATLLTFSFAKTVHAQATNTTNRLSVEVDGIRSQKGKICLDVYASDQGFLRRDKTIQRVCTQITGNSVHHTFSGLKPGSYAVAVLHDENGDGILNRNSLGMPIEGFGVSGNPPITNSTPKFSDAAFILAGSNTKIKINLNYDILVNIKY